MGLSTIAAFALVLVSGIAAGAQVAAALSDYASAVGSASKEKQEMMLRDLHTRIEIVNVTYSGGKTRIYAENRGSTTLDPDKIALVVDGAWLPSTSFQIGGLGYFADSTSMKTKLVKGAFYNSSGKVTLTTQDATDIIATGGRDELWGVVGWFNISVVTKTFVYSNTSSSFYWRPRDVIEIITTQSIVNTSKVIVENGAWAEYRNVSIAGHEHALPIENYDYVWS